MSPQGIDSSHASMFISYVREDEDKVEKLYQELRDADFQPWMAKKDLFGGQKWWVSIQEAIRRSDFFLVCLSTNSVDKGGHIEEEIGEALAIWQEKAKDKIYLIPVRLEACEVPENLREIQWVDWFEEDGWIQLLKAI